MNIVFDIDSTLSDPKHRLHYVTGPKKNYDTFYQLCRRDTPIIPMVNVYREMHKTHRIFVITGRPERVRQETTDWFKAHALQAPDQLIMRKDHDFRKDYDYKLAALVKLRRAGFVVDLAFDDSPGVVDAFNDYGILTCQLPREFGFHSIDAKGRTESVTQAP